jgi:hypothetical protein
MKNTFAPYYKNLSRFGFLAFLAFFITMNLLLTSCVDEPEAPTVELEETTSVAKVKAWFEENKTKLRLPERGTNFRSESQELILPFFEKEPDWDKFHHYYFPDGREVFEISLDNHKLYLPEIRSGENQQEVAKRALQSILFVKNPTENRFDPLIIRYYPDEETSKRDFKEINYQMIDEKWSGIVDVFTYDEHHFIGFEINKGQILATRNYETIQDGNRKGFGIENMDFRCSVVTTDWYQISYAPSTNTYVIQTLSPTRSYSCPSGGYLPDSGPGETYTYGTNGTGTTGLGGGTTGYNPPDVPMPKLTIYIDYSISSNSNVNCIVNKLALNSFVNSIADFTNTKDVNTNSIIKLGPTSKPGSNGQTRDKNGIYEITINSSQTNRPDLMIARTILHELVHAEIMAALKENRITPLDDNFPANLDSYIALYLNTDSRVGDKHHNYMATNLLPRMGQELMNIHRNQFPEDFQRFNEYVKDVGYPKGLSEDFYMNIFWEGLEHSLAYQQMAAITVQKPLLSPVQKVERDLLSAASMTKPCGN